MCFFSVAVYCSNFQDFTKSPISSIWEASTINYMYPKVKVKKQIEEANQYSYERSSLPSLKAFEWLSLDHSSASDENARSPVRIPNSPTPRLQEDEREKKKNKKARRPRAVVSSPDNDGMFTSKKTQTRRELLLALKSHDLCQRHNKCKIFPAASGGAGFD